jgi:hypothetical protein
MTSSTEFHNQQLGMAISLAAQAFAERYDKQGKPYILHCLRVMDAIKDDVELQVVAVLHDIIEDTEWDLIGLATKLILTTRQQISLAALTHDPNDSYDDYIRGVAVNPGARRIKLADLVDNSNITRLKGLRKKDFERLEKYHRAFVYLSE